MTESLDLEFESAYRGESVAFGRGPTAWSIGEPQPELALYDRAGRIPRRRPRLRGLQGRPRFRGTGRAGDTPRSDGPPPPWRRLGMRSSEARPQPMRLRVADAPVRFSATAPGSTPSSTARCSAHAGRGPGRSLSAIDRACGTRRLYFVLVFDRAAIPGGRSMRSPEPGNCAASKYWIIDEIQARAAVRGFPAGFAGMPPGHPRRAQRAAVDRWLAALRPTWADGAPKRHSPAN